MRTIRLIVLLLLIAASLRFIHFVWDGGVAVYCSLSACASIESKESGKPIAGSRKDTSVANRDVGNEARPSPPPARAAQRQPPTAKDFALPAIEALDGSRSKAGTMTKIKLSVVDNKGNGPDTFIAQWTWSGSGGTQNGREMVIVNVKSDSGSTLETLKIPLDRTQCFYPGHDERHEGELTISAALVAAIEVSITPVEGRQTPC